MLSTWWQSFVEGRSNFVLYGLMPSLVVTFAYLSAAVFCFWLERRESLRPWKIQKKVHPNRTWGECLKHVFLHKLTSEIPLTLGAYPIFVWLGVESGAPLPSLWTIVWTLTISFVIEDAWHYFAHRSLHAKWAYAKIHHIHHKYTTPFGIAANYAHPLETFYTGFGTILSVLIIRPHLSTMLIWIVARQWQAVAVHVGYDFPWRLSRVLPILGGARFHDRHHERFTCNYAPTFVWWDRILKTADEENLGVKPANEEAIAIADDR